jgi:hypothetical protein
LVARLGTKIARLSRDNYKKKLEKLSLFFLLGARLAAAD